MGIGKAYIYGLVISFILLFLWWAMLPSSSNPEDVVRSYLGHMRLLKVDDNYDLLSTSLKEKLQCYGIHNNMDFFDYRIGDGAGMRGYCFVDTEESDSLTIIKTELTFSSYSAFIDPYSYEASAKKRASQVAFDFFLVNEDGDWLIDCIATGEGTLLP